MLAATVVGVGNTDLSSQITEVAEVSNEVSLKTEELDQDKEIADLVANDVESQVREYFSDIPILVNVSRCESHFRQFDTTGKVLRGDHNPADVGVMQINEYYHGETAKKLGLNLHTLEGNMAYARYLYEKEGTRPWNYSSKCWGKTREVALNN